MFRYIFLFIFFTIVADATIIQRCTGERNDRLLLDLRDCQLYTHCHRGRDFEKFCIKGTKFDVDLQRCIPGACPVSCFCDSSLGIVELSCKFKQNGVRYADPNNCRGYYRCHRGRVHKSTCPLNYRFNEDKHRCIKGYCPPCICPTVSIKVPITRSLTQSSIPLSTRSSIQLLSSAEAAASASTKNPNPNKINCDDKLNGYKVKDSEFCHVYWVCVHGIALRMECPRGTLFNGKQCHHTEEINNCVGGKYDKY